jgi:hypothetical protein
MKVWQPSRFFEGYGATMSVHLGRDGAGGRLADRLDRE